MNATSKKRTQRIATGDQSAKFMRLAQMVSAMIKKPARAANQTPMNPVIESPSTKPEYPLAMTTANAATFVNLTKGLRFLPFDPPAQLLSGPRASFADFRS